MSNYTKIFVGLFVVAVCMVAVFTPVQKYMTTLGIEVEQFWPETTIPLPALDINIVETEGESWFETDMGQPKIGPDGLINTYKRYYVNAIEPSGPGNFHVMVSIDGTQYSGYITMSEFKAHKNLDGNILLNIVSEMEVFGLPIITVELFPTDRKTNLTKL